MTPLRSQGSASSFPRGCRYGRRRCVKAIRQGSMLVPHAISDLPNPELLAKLQRLQSVFSAGIGRFVAFFCKRACRKYFFAMRAEDSSCVPCKFGTCAFSISRGFIAGVSCIWWVAQRMRRAYARCRKRGVPSASLKGVSGFGMLDGLGVAYPMPGLHIRRDSL
ncbi:hypothetical protein HMPREF0762_01905 [Slackia exigua ATCC 700122]|uniref:Uncharacterized protein n=1 Tax=Slackia exigua (strain ATCC 700122 / DSM 15923 / CIP 105133 / JCM 11022 / KCTC 5966 / S-7) TaxID=649764 RepID=D0WJ79_SLAES|nr:hypothetical protein HMPREF0762_01905 [Slackia exigua ATCC 700122]